jgi:hypothetical protein
LPAGAVYQRPIDAGLSGDRLWAVFEALENPGFSSVGDYQVVVFDLSATPPNILSDRVFQIFSPVDFVRTAIRVDGDWLYVVSNDSIAIYPLGGPADASPLETIQQSSRIPESCAVAHGVAVGTGFGHEYVLDARGLASGATPEVVSTFDASLRTQAVVRDGLLLSFSQSQYFTYPATVVDVSHPATPVVATPFGPDTLLDVAFGDGLTAVVRLTNDSYETPRVLDLYEGIAPEHSDAIGSLCLNCRDAYFSFNFFDGEDRVELVGDTAVTAVMGLTSIDISDPSNPKLVQRMHGADRSLAVQTRGDLAFSANTVRGFSVWNIADPTKPISLVSVATEGDASGLFLQDNILYVTISYEGVSVFDVGTPDAPVKITSFPTTAYASDILPVPGGVAVTSGAGVEFFSGDPVSGFVPAGVVNLDEDSFGQDLVLRDGLLFVASGFNGLHIIDPADLTNPALLASSRPEGLGFCEGVTLDGDTAYLASRDGIGVVDIADPMHPVALGVFEAATPTSKLTARDGLLYGTGLHNPLSVYSLENPREPRLVWTVESVSEYYGIDFVQAVEHWIEGDRIVVTEGTTNRTIGRGLTIRELPEVCEYPCSDADLVPPFGVLDLADVSAFVDSFTRQGVRTDYAAPYGVWDLADLVVFVEAFAAGCP